MIEDSPIQPCLHKICRWDQLEAETLCGWSFVEVVHETVSVPYMEDEIIVLPPNPNAGSSGSNGYFQRSDSEYRNVSVTRHHPQNLCLCLLKLSPGNSIALANRTTEQAIKERDDALKTLQGKDEQIKKLQDMYSTESKELVRIKDLFKSVSNELQSRSTVQRKLEADLASVRNAIGKLRFDEIVNSDGTKD